MRIVSLHQLEIPIVFLGGGVKFYMVWNLFNRSAHSPGPEFRIWSSELGITVARDCPQTVHMLQISAQNSGTKSLEFLKFLEPGATHSGGPSRSPLGSVAAPLFFLVPQKVLHACT